MYALPSLMANRYGPLQVDLEHAKILDAKDHQLRPRDEAAEPRSVRFGLTLRF